MKFVSKNICKMLAKNRQIWATQLRYFKKYFCWKLHKF